MAFIKRHFAYDNPRFGRSAKEKSTEPFKNSVYYYWWEFLRRSNAYKKCCESGGKGKLKKLYEDFGDVFAVDFKTWWQENDRGASLFAEEAHSEFKILTEQWQHYKNDNVIVLQVPLHLPKRHLMREFQNVLNRNHAGRRGIRANRVSTAKYPVLGHVDVDALDKCLRVYDMKINNPKMYFWKVAQESKATSSKQFVLSDGSETNQEISDKKLILANTATRLIRKAKLIIRNTEKGIFPKSV